jgi:uncharacterized protein
LTFLERIAYVRVAAVLQESLLAGAEHESKRMQVKIEEITERGLHRSEALNEGELTEALADAPDFALVRGGTLTAEFKKISGQVHVKGSFDVLVNGTCKRCTTAVETPTTVSFSLRMVVEAKPDDEDEEEAVELSAGAKRRQQRRDLQAEREGTFDLDEIDAEPFDGKLIDLGPIVREQLLLALPVSVLCQEDCLGLCAQCGADLNLAPCGHSSQKPIDPRLQKLATIQLKH